MYIYVYKYVHVYIYAYTLIWIYTSIDTYIYMCLYICECIYSQKPQQNREEGKAGNEKNKGKKTPVVLRKDSSWWIHVESSAYRDGRQTEG